MNVNVVVNDKVPEEKVEKPAPAKDKDNILLEANRESLYSNISLDNFGLGLGLRASLPKMPSFRRKKLPSPVIEDEDSRKFSDSEEIVHHSDTEEGSRGPQVSFLNFYCFCMHVKFSLFCRYFLKWSRIFWSFQV